MDFIWDIVKDMGAMQWMLLVAAFVLVLPKLRSIMGKVVDDGSPQHTNTGLTSIVAKWEVLMDACHKAKMNDACEKLQEVFPLLVQKYKAEHEHTRENS